MPNFPWSGRLGRVARRCLSCGAEGPSFRLSSHPIKCLPCYKDSVPADAGLLAAHRAECERLARAWCRKNGVPYGEALARA